MADDIFGAIELGGTKIKVATGTRDGRIVTELAFATRQPGESFEMILSFFANNRVVAIGVGAFGPVTVSHKSVQYGRIGITPKPGWSGFDISHALAPLGVPMAIDTDVNAALIGEFRRGAAADCRVAVYLTIGTGIGGGLLVDGRPVHGLLHPEMGHLRVIRDPGDDLHSQCPFHANCVEGLASGPAIIARFGKPLSALPADHGGHDLIADYIGQLCAAIVLIASPEVIIIGGGVAKTPLLHTAISRRVRTSLNGYISARDDNSCRIVPPKLHGSSGLMGALELAYDAIDDYASGQKRPAVKQAPSG